MPAELIWDNANPANLLIPEAMGKPAAHQLQGSPLDNLAELCGRVCYDSLGSEKSRSSKEYHRHIREVTHLSVYRHCAFTVEFETRPYQHVRPEVFLNRPGIWVIHGGYETPEAKLRVTMNLQNVIEWRRPVFIDSFLAPDVSEIEKTLQVIASGLAPMSCGHFEPNEQIPMVGKVVSPKHPEERWLSFYINDVSRGLTHELVRHGAGTAVSQRSTRYCDESDSEWVWHPLMCDTLTSSTWEKIGEAQEAARDSYNRIVDDMLRAGVERKQARGAARGMLGNALSTELIFSASLARWREIGALRNHPLADGEIRELFAQIEDLLPKD